MPREAALFDEAGGSPLRGYLLLKSRGGNIPPMWIDRAHESRKRREKAVATSLKSGRLSDVINVEDWELAYRKECFYRGLRVLLELERNGKSKF